MDERRDPNWDFGTNPCSEIILRNREFCNLSEIIIREDDTFETLAEKVRRATILGTWQSSLTNFKYISKEWKKNCEEERLLGVSMTGIMDNKIMNGSSSPKGMKGWEGYSTLEEILQALKKIAVSTNKEWAKILKINPAAAITCVKPSGTVSQLVDSASGIHSRHAEFFIRTVRADNKDSLCQFMKDAGFPWEPEVNKPEHTSVFSFPFKSPKSSVFRMDKTAVEQLELWLKYQDNWCEHKPSITVYLQEYEWPEVGAWVWNHFDKISGISFLPMMDHVYRQAPYQDCSKEEYEKFLNERMPKNINWEDLSNYEKQDMTMGSQTYACSADGACEIPDLI